MQRKRCGGDQQPTCENGTNTVMVMMKKNQVGVDNVFKSARITTLFAEASRMSQPWCSSFSPKLLREEYKHFKYTYQILIPTYRNSSFQCVFRALRKHFSWTIPGPVAFENGQALIFSDARTTATAARGLRITQNERTI